MRLRKEAALWQGTPHCMGGLSRRCIDCSGLVKQIYKKVFALDLPRTTSRQVKLGRGVTWRELASGDLVFFKIPGWGFTKKRHVGIYLGRGQFVHASQSSGVIISNLDNPFWADVFWTARRPLGL